MLAMVTLAIIAIEVIKEQFIFLCACANLPLILNLHRFHFVLICI